MPRLLLATTCSVVLLAHAPAGASAALTLLKPNPGDPATFSGNGGYSADGLGQNVNGGTIQAEVPAGSTVEQAYLYGTYFFTFDPTLAERTIDFGGSPVELTKIADASFDGFGLASARADVTAQVAAKVGSGGGTTDFVVGSEDSDHAGMNGVGLVVIYSNPTMPHVTVAVLDGAASQGDHSASFDFAAPLDKTVPGFSASMSLGIAFSSQGNTPGHICDQQEWPAPPAASLVDVNGTRLTSCAGHYDDGTASAGALITVGGVGDSTNNPADPFQRPTDGAMPRVEDDELYDIEPLLSQGDMAATITSHPWADDNLFLEIIAITAKARVSKENCSNGIDDDGDGLVDGNDLDCSDTRRMTGGGSILGSRVTHGFTLRCDTTTLDLPQRLQVNWRSGDRFHLTELDSAACTDTDAIGDGVPIAGFDTYEGSGTGRYNGVDWARAEWTITDAGEPGINDTFTIKITDAEGNVVLEAGATLQRGNHQAHS